MSDADSSVRSAEPSFKLWPGVVIVVLQWFATFAIGKFMPASMIQFFGIMIGPPLGVLALFGWWLKVSNWPRGRKLLVVLLPFPLFALALFLADPSVYQAVYIYGMPCLAAAFLGWLGLRRITTMARPVWAWVAILVVICGGWAVVRTTGVDGDMAYDFEPRWTSTAEQELLAASSGLDGSAASADLAVELAASDWPGLRGPLRDGVVPGVRIGTDWSATPPEVIWKHPVGPGWGSFAVAGEVIFTQEQRGEDEVVSAYSASTGEPIWQHADAARFWESMAGAGPRATPTFADGRVYTLGATGILQALDASDGRQIWQRNLSDDTGAPLPQWGFSASPLVAEGLVVVHGGAPDGKAIAAYDADSGEPKWFAPAGPLSYCSMHAATLEGTPQMLVTTGDGVTSVSYEGEVLWKHDWMAENASRVVQPAFTDGGDVLVGTSFGMGTRRFSVSKSGDSWSTEEVWTSPALKPYYNDIVVHEGYVYGFDNRILAALDVKSGDRVWKGGRYGNGQLLLLPDQDLLLVVSDRGELALVRAVPDGFEEVATFQAIKGKTWNHLALADGVLYVRNAEEMAAVRLPAA